MARPVELLLIVGLYLCSLASSAGSDASSGFQGLGALASEAHALEMLAQAGAVDKVLASPNLASGMELLVHRGWHEAVTALVAASHKSSEEAAQKVAAQVRHAVYAERKHLDDLIRSLDRNYARAVDVSPAMQWAQNSTHVFLAIKFCQRWNAPGALEVENETVSFAGGCFNFTAFGEHSFIRRRYHLSFELFQPTLSAASSWFFASAGRVTVIIAKALPGNWPRLMAAGIVEPKNLGVWRDMREKWKEDLMKLPTEELREKKAPSAEKKAKNSKKQKGRRKAEETEEDDEAAVDREVELLSDCPKSTYSDSSVAELCEKTFQEVVAKPAVPGRRWLVEMYSSTGTGDLEAMRKLMPLWKRIADVFPSMAPGGRVGAVDCGYHKELCKKLGATKLPQIRRFSSDAAASGDTWKGSLDASMETLATWGSGKDEL